jgi:tRNA (guanine-N7-)-methyltransferase
MNQIDLFITRKRKKWKFAHFNEWDNCFQFDDIKRAHWKDYFQVKNPKLIVEIGAGTADLSVMLAQAHPDQQYIAIDIKSDRLYTGAKYAREHEMSNIAFVRAHVEDLPRIFQEHVVSELWITFPDPYPRKKDASRRLTYRDFLKTYEYILMPNGVLRFKTDSDQLFAWSLEQLVKEEWHCRELTFDLHESGLLAEYKLTTRYERKFIAQGISIGYVSATPPLHWGKS